MRTAGYRRVDGSRTDTAEVLSQPAAAFCGIGNPASFFDHLRREGFQLALTRTFPDHHNYNQSELESLVGDAKGGGAKILLTTAKDATKLQSFNPGLPCYVLDIQISIDEEDRLVDLIRKAIF
jgi:tetraacyldisaccharide-1-P 4'-kinase